MMCASEGEADMSPGGGGVPCLCVSPCIGGGIRQDCVVLRGSQKFKY